jgi:hypothetical protein
MNRDGPRHLRQAESPDEGEFVSFARNLGFFFCRRTMRVRPGAAPSELPLRSCPLAPNCRGD